MTRIVSTRFGISYPDPALRNEPADVPGDLKKLVDAIETAAINLQGTSGSRPVASIQGRFYRETDTKKTFYDTGTAWEQIGDTPPGVVMPWPYAEANVPAGWALSYGQTVSRSANPILNAIASANGYPHGAGDGSTTFNLPDMRGRIVVGKDNMGGTAANRIPAAKNGTTLAGTYGTHEHQLVPGELAAHGHTVNTHSHGGGVHSHGITDAGHTHLGAANRVSTGNLAGGNNVLTGLNNYPGGTVFGFTSDHYLMDLATPGLGVSINNSAATISGEAPGTNSAGGDLFHNNLQPGMIMNHIIKLG